MNSRMAGEIPQTTSWKQVTPFAGRVVAYDSKAPYFVTGSKYKINKFFFGPIDRDALELGSEGEGHNMRRLVKS